MNMYADIFPTFVNPEVRNVHFEIIFIMYIVTGITNIGYSIHKMKKKFETYMSIEIKKVIVIDIFMFERRE